MLLTGVSDLSKTNRINSIQRFSKTNKISFKGSFDEFVSKPEAVFGNLTNEETAEIVNIVKSNKPVASGWTSNIFKFKDKIIKAPKDKDFDEPYLKTQLQGQNLKEYFALNKINEISPDIAVNPYGIIKDKESYYLIEQMAQGKHPNQIQLSTKVIKDLLSKFFKLDTNGIINCDLQPGNIFIKDDKAKLIDFGSYDFIINSGLTAGSDYAPVEIFKPGGQIFDDTNLDFPVRFMKTFLAEPFCDTKNLMDNPYINMPSNAANFEIRTLYSHLLDKSEENPLEFFKTYLKLKVDEYHSKMKEFMQSLKPDDLINYETNEEQVEIVKAGLKNAINYEDLAQKALISDDIDIIKAQAAKLQLRTFLNFGDSLASPVENSKKLQAAYNNLISILEEGKNNPEGDKKEYFSQTLEYFKKVFENYNFEDGQVEIPENENLIKVLFEKMPEEVQKEVKQIEQKVPETKENIEKTINAASKTIKNNVENTVSSNKKSILPFVVFATFILAVFAFVMKKIKKNKQISAKHIYFNQRPLSSFLKAQNAHKTIKSGTLMNYNLFKNSNPAFSQFGN